MKCTKWLFLFGFIFSRCTPTGSVSKEELNNMNIAGAVRLFDDMKNPEPKDGMLVKIEGTSFATYTDTGGIYQFAVVPYGTYTISYEKEGYGTFMEEAFNHLNDGDGKPAVVPVVSLGKTATTTVTALSVRLEEDTVHFTSTINPPGTTDSARNVRYFFGSTAAVSSTDFMGQGKGFEAKSATAIFKLIKSDFTAMGFASGQTVFVKAYGDGEHSNEYTDPATSRLVFPNLNSTVTADTSFVLP